MTDFIDLIERYDALISLAMIVALLIISFLPGLSLGLPRIFLDYGG